MHLKTEPLKTALIDIFDQIERRLNPISIEDLDEIIDSFAQDDEVILKRLMEHREKILKYKEDTSFWDNEIPNLISLLEDSKARIRAKNRIFQ